MSVTGRYRNFIKNNRTIFTIFFMLIPATITLFIFSYLPMFGVLMAFENYSSKKGIFGSEWIGLKNFILLFSFSDFWKALSNTIIISLGRLIFEFPAAIILAILINEVKPGKFRKITQTVFTFPHFLSWVIAAGVLMNILCLDGLLNSLLLAVGIITEPIAFLATPSMFRPLLFITSIWKEAGWNCIIYIAAIAGIDEQLFESASIDGTNRFQKIIYIILPSISETITILFILSVGGILNAGFDQIFNMYNPIVRDVSEILDTYIYNVTFGRGADYGFSTAVGLFKSLVGLFLMIGANQLSQKLTNKGLYSLK